MQEAACEHLLEQLCSAVHKIQEEYASGTGVIRDGDAVNHLCRSVDEILRHGLKEGILHWVPGTETTYWPIVSRITYKEVIQDILSHQEVKNDCDRCQLWLRLAVQENALGSYLNVITQDEKLQREFYQSYAFICDKEKVETAKTALLYGLSHLDFNISIAVPQDLYRPSRSHTGSYNSIGSFTEHLPAKPVLINGFEAHGSSDTSCTEQGSLTSTSSLTRNQDGGKKKKRKKKVAGVAVISDSFDDQMLPSIEKYLSPKSEKSLAEYHDDNLLSDRTDGACAGKGPLKGVSVDADVLQSHHIPVSEEELLSSNFAVQATLKNKVKDSEGHGSSSVFSKEVFEKKHEEMASCDQSSLTQIITEGNNAGTEEDNQEDTHLSSTPIHNSDDCISSEVIDDLDTEQYKVSTAVFEFGTPKEVSFAEAMEKDTSLASTEEDEDLNFVPGIHKSNEQLSRSSSFSSFTGSGSFSNGHKGNVEKPHRSSTMDSSKTNTSSVGSSLASETWKYVTNSVGGGTRKDSKADDVSVTTEDSLSDLGIFDELLGIDEDHYSPPESFMGFSSSEELQNAILSCKDLIRKAPDQSGEKKKLVEKLIQLRIRLQDTRDDHRVREDSSNTKKVLGHNFVKEEGRSNHLCDRCGKWVWTMWQSLFTCQACKFHSHRKCLPAIRRHCASRKVSMVSTYNVAICPESGLSAQQYKCAECRKKISLTKGESAEARLCDYSGQYFCEECHWNDQMVIPARIVHNWDFSIYKVARQNKQLLSLMLNKPSLNLEELNPALFKFVGELREIKRLREEILIMKKYFMSCRAALDSKLLLHLLDRQHFVDNSYQYSLQDMIDVERGTLLPFITRVHSLFLTHIKTECELCQAKGFICELCKAKDVIFAFDPHAIQCPKCRTVLHKVCLRMDKCPKCERRRKRSKK